MNNKLFLSLSLVLVAGVVLTACAAPSSSPTGETTPTEVEQTETEMGVESLPASTESGAATSDAPPSEKLVLTMAELAKHNSAQDCWLLIEGKVYDVTPYIANAKHPGGATLLEGCGIDATSLFNERPMDSGTPHSDKARMGLDQYYIGELVTTE